MRKVLRKSLSLFTITCVLLAVLLRIHSRFTPKFLTEYQIISCSFIDVFLKQILIFKLTFDNVDNANEVKIMLRTQRRNSYALINSSALSFVKTFYLLYV